MLPVFKTLTQGRRVILASGSPRRRQLLTGLGLDLEIIPSTFEEDLEISSFLRAEDYVRQTAQEKAHDVLNSILRAQEVPKTDILVIGCDTVVVRGEAILEKPVTKDQAISMLTMLSGNIHRVLTAVVFLHQRAPHDQDPHIHSFVEETTVHFGSLTQEEIAAYVETGEPMDKAGGYGYQGLAGCLIDRIDGDYYNVVGMPLRRFYQECLKVLSLS
ncbi:hypothetical protein BJ684DRAFT_18622 [Piptocephalis cylindrospora]|uniref:Uncharacterized protein n=1 Tax=Piptocephalis cylindrospora TaxID=1907219 RepID=A0A4P9Y8A8_9FUNG|nr:hypothetical protein BJ684DRAFT_18622 [Piptocephalis cylindrospora]|eukprot:RKP15014.1 hypothetical protein BJ684DRAFT_18622 [Piptocephalis cylindrospora]